MKIEILLSTYNGQKYLSEQIDSLLHQEYDDFHILIRDDGSSDKTADIIQAYSERYPQKITFIRDGKKLGYPDCFWKLLECAPEADLYAFCDQDDVWEKNKLESCNGLCCQYDSRKPLLYVHDYFVCEANLNPYKTRHLNETGFSPDYPYNLVYYVMSPGFTMVMNDELRKRILRDRLSGKGIPHDRWTFWCGFFAGTIINDPKVLVRYRRHNDSVTQTGKNNWIVFKEWWKEDIRGNRLGRWNRIARYFSDCYEKEMHTKYASLPKDWKIIAGEGNGVIPYLKRLFFPKALKPGITGEIVLRICFLLNKK